MGNLLSQFLGSFIASSLVMKHNLDWHRKLVWIFVPLFIIFTQAQTEYLIKRILQKQDS